MILTLFFGKVVGSEIDCQETIADDFWVSALTLALRPLLFNGYFLSTDRMGLKLRAQVLRLTFRLRQFFFMKSF